MAKQDYSFKTEGGGYRYRVADEATPDNVSRPDMPQLEPALRGIAENAGFDVETLEGEALLAKNNRGSEFASLRDGDNKDSLGTQPDYPVNLMDEFAKGKDLRSGR